MLDFKRKPLIAMLHLRSDSNMSALERAKQEIDIYTRAGMDAVLVENYFGNVADCRDALAYLQTERPQVCYGVNILGNYMQAFELASHYGASFVQIDSVCGHLTRKPDAEYADELSALRARYPHIQVLGGVRFKYQPVKSGRSLEEDLQLGQMRCNAVVTTGEATGMDCPTEKLKLFRTLLGDFPLIIGAGATGDNIAEKLFYADGVIIGSWLKEGHNAQGEVSDEYVRAFVRAAHPLADCPNETHDIVDSAEKLLKGLELENAYELEQAYAAYREVADAGNPLAMLAIGNLYMYKRFRGLHDLTELVGMFMPWEHKPLKPDMKSAYEWFFRAAQAGNTTAMNNVGVMLHYGNGCDAYQNQSRQWLRQAAQGHNYYASKALKDFFGEETLPELTDAQYSSMLDRFCILAQSGDEEADSLYGRLINAAQSQLSRLSYYLAIGKYNMGGMYLHFAYPASEIRESVEPLTMFRHNWMSFIIVNLAAFSESSPTLSFASDICARLIPIKGVCCIPETVTYRAKPFGWLSDEERVAGCLRFNADYHSPDAERELASYHVDLKSLLEKLNLAPDEALFAEDGEKEYSVEICHVKDNDAKVIKRYSLGSYDDGTRSCADVEGFSRKDEICSRHIHAMIW